MGFFVPSVVEHEGAPQTQTADKEIPHHPASMIGIARARRVRRQRSLIGGLAYVVV